MVATITGVSYFTILNTPPIKEQDFPKSFETVRAVRNDFRNTITLEKLNDQIWNNFALAVNLNGKDEQPTQKSST